MSHLLHCPRDGVPGEPVRRYRQLDMLMRCPQCGGKWFVNQGFIDRCTQLVFTTTPFTLCPNPCAFVETFFDRNGRDRFGFCADHLVHRLRFWDEVDPIGLARHVYPVEASTP